MIQPLEIDLAYPLTDGVIAFNNLESSRQQSWSRFWRDPLRPEMAEYTIEQEQLTLQFVGDPSALDRLQSLANHLDRIDAGSPRTTLIHAQVASMAHCFSEAKRHIDEIGDWGDWSNAANRLSLTIDQACGTRLDAVLQIRQRMAVESGRLEDLVPLGALLADLGKLDDADQTFLRALREYKDTSPFAVAWVCFQLGLLWGELNPKVELTRAARYYQKALEFLPGYVKARVHLAEIYLRSDLLAEAEELLMPAVLSGDPEVRWCLSEVLAAMGRPAEAQEQMQAARISFEVLLEKHPLAFADHAAEFYARSGNNPQRASELANINLANRPTLRAFEKAYDTAMIAGQSEDAAKVLTAARSRWGTTSAFRVSPLANVDAGEPRPEVGTA
ncbi:MAG: tetratricopeptide repeat protein [Candidatus Acidiferrum sp.]